MKTLIKISTVPALLAMMSANALALPDLVVRNIRLLPDCKIEITIANIGKTGVPATGYHRTRGAAVQMYKGAKPWGGLRLTFVDPQKKLMKPGTSVKHIWFPRANNLRLGPGVHSLRLTVDKNNAVRESNESNNTRTKRVKCRKRVRRLPDLTITKIGVDRKCHIVVGVKNIGRGPVPMFVWTRHYPKSSSVYLRINGKPWGGQTIWKFNPSKSLRAPGGTGIYRSRYRVKGKVKVTASVDHTLQVKESNERNNVRSRLLRCGR